MEYGSSTNIIRPDGDTGAGWDKSWKTRENKKTEKKQKQRKYAKGHSKTKSNKARVKKGTKRDKSIKHLFSLYISINTHILNSKQAININQNNQPVNRQRKRENTWGTAQQRTMRGTTSGIGCTKSHSWYGICPVKTIFLVATSIANKLADGVRNEAILQAIELTAP
jgi:hypothetical protein